jgi:hypothetical protein
VFWRASFYMLFTPFSKIPAKAALFDHALGAPSAHPHCLVPSLSIKSSQIGVNPQNETVS